LLTNHLKLWLAFAAAIAALTILVFARDIAQGSGLIVATLAAGAGYLIRDVNDEARTLRTICQAYASLIEAHFEEINDSLSDAELERLLALAPAIAQGREPESIGARAADPFASLPDIRSRLHLLSAATVRYIWKWRVRGGDLFLVYDQLGTRALSATPELRLKRFFEWVKQYREEYRDIGYTALLAIKRDAPSLDIDTKAHEAAGATLVV
jgi:hypothetical protein